MDPLLEWVISFLDFRFGWLASCRFILCRTYARVKDLSIRKGSYDIDRIAIFY